MSELPQGTQQPPEQPGNGTPAPEQAAGTPGQQTPQAAPNQPTLEQVQAQLQQEQAARQQQDQQYRALQADYTRKAQALAQLAGAQSPQAPPPDPLAAYVSKLTGKGYAEKEARAITEIQYEMVQERFAPLQQQLQQSYQQANQLAQVDNMLGAAYRTDASVFPNQQIYDQVRATASNYAQQGGQLDPEIILSIANDAAYRFKRGQPVQQPPPQQQPQAPLGAQPFRNGTTFMAPNFATPLQQPSSAPLTGAALDVDEEMKKRFKP